MAVAKPPTTFRKPMTEEEFLRLPDDGQRYELVEGEARAVPAGFRHDAIAVNLILLLGPLAKGRGYMTASQAGFRMRNGNIRCPDVSFTRKERLPDGQPPTGFGDFAPDLAIEIISPSEEPAEIQRKLAEYFDTGAQRVWHLLPETQTVKVFTGPAEFTILQATDEIDAGDLIPGFHCLVAALFALD